MSRIEQLRQFLLENPEDPFLHYALTMEYVKLGDEEEAVRNFEKMVRDYPDYVGTYYHFGKLLEQTGAVERAKAIYRAGIDVAIDQRNRHAMGELQGALALLDGYEEDDDEG